MYKALTIAALVATSSGQKNFDDIPLVNPSMPNTFDREGGQ